MIDYDDWLMRGCDEGDDESDMCPICGLDANDDNCEHTKEDIEASYNDDKGEYLAEKAEELMSAIDEDAEISW